MIKLILTSTIIIASFQPLFSQKGLQDNFIEKVIKSIKTEKFKYLATLLPTNEDKTSLTDSCLASLTEDYPAPDSVLINVIDRKFNNYQIAMNEEVEPTFNRLLQNFKNESINFKSIIVTRTEFNVGWRDCLYQGKITIHINTNKGPYQLYFSECIKSKRTWLIGERFYLRKE